MSKGEYRLRGVLITVLVLIILAICIFTFYLHKENKNITESTNIKQADVVGGAALQGMPEQDTTVSENETRISTADDLDTIMKSSQVDSIEELECIAACYDTSTVSEVKYTGIPQVDNCIYTLLGSGEYKPMEDTDDYIDDYPVHIYVIDVNNKVFSIIYYEDIEAIAIPLDMTPAEYYSGYEIDTSEED